jgi:AAA domain
MTAHTQLPASDPWAPGVRASDVPIVRPPAEPATAQTDGLDPDAASAAFLRDYFRGTEGRIYLAAIRNPKSKMGAGEVDKLLTREPGEVARFVAAYDRPECDCAIYYCTATLRDGHAKRDAAGCRQFPSLFADCDDANHELDRDRVVALLQGLECPPTMIVDSGHGLQPHWLLDEPSENAERIVAARKKLQGLVASDAVHDAPRFMRLPGSHNSKRGDWLPVKIVAKHPERRYALEALEQWLDTAEIAIARRPVPAKTNGTAPDMPFVLPPAIGPGTDHRRGAAWARRALEESARELANAGEGMRHNTLRDKSVRMATMVARGWIDVQEVRSAFFAASQACGQVKDYGVEHFEQTLAAGLKHGMAMPHPDLPDNDPPRPDRPPGEPLRDDTPMATEYPASADGERDVEADAATGQQKRTGTEQTEKPKARQAPVSWWRDPATIPPRQSLYDGHYIRRAIGATIGGGGRAKTTRGVYEGICMSVGVDIATKAVLPEGKLRVWVCNGEEDQDELDRRVSATCQRYGITRDDLGGRLFVQSVRDNPLRIATLVNNRPVIDQAVLKYMTDFIKDNGIDLFMLDPLVSFHGVMENDNGHMDLVVKEGFGAIANQTNSAGEMFHHPGKAKPGQPDTSVEDGRGASAILWAVRSARVFNFMTPDEAAKLGMTEDDRKLHIRIANGKANMGPLGKAKWMKLVVEDLVNGDHVAVASPWSPPDPFKGITAADMELARKLAATGEYRADSRSPKWIGYAIADHLQVAVSHQGDNDPKDMARLNSIVKTWLKNKVLDIDERKDTDGKDRKFIIAGSFKPSPTAYPGDEASLQ